MRKIYFVLMFMGMVSLSSTAQAFVLLPTDDGMVIDGFVYNVGLVPKDGVADQVDVDQSVALFNNDLAEYRGIMEFDVTGVSDPITSAYLKLTTIDALGPYPLNLQMYGYNGDGAVTFADYNAGTFLSSFDFNNEDAMIFDVTSFVQDLKTNNGDFAAFNLRLLNVAPVETGPPYVAFGSLEEPQAAQLFLNENPNVVPEPATLLTLACGILGVLFFRRQKLLKS